MDNFIKIGNTYRKTKAIEAMNNFFFSLRRIKLVPENIYGNYGLKKIGNFIFFLFNLSKTILAQILLLLATLIVFSTLDVSKFDDNSPYYVLSLLIFVYLLIHHAWGYQIDLDQVDFLETYHLSYQKYSKSLFLDQKVSRAITFALVIIIFTKNPMIIGSLSLANLSGSVLGMLLNQHLYSITLRTRKLLHLLELVMIVSLGAVAYFFDLQKLVFSPIFTIGFVVFTAVIFYHFWRKPYDREYVYHLSTNTDQDLFNYYLGQIDRGVSFLSLLWNNPSSEKKAIVTISNDDFKANRKNYGTGIKFLNNLLFARYRRKLLSRALYVMFCGILLAVAIIISNYFGVIGIKSLERYTNLLVCVGCLAMLISGFGQTIVKICFNCDQPLLNYPFYNQKELILQGFWQRLKKNFSWNLVVVLALGIDFGLVAYLMKPNNFLLVISETVVILLIIALVISFHELFLYYLLQPFTSGGSTHSKINSLYSILQWQVILFIMSFFMGIDTTIMMDWLILLGFVLYVLIGSMVLNSVVARTFRLKE